MNTTDASRHDPPRRDAPPIVLALFVSGASARSADALATVRDVCERRLAGRYTLEVIDIYRQPEALAHERLVSAPTLVRRSPGPVERLVGDVADERRLHTLLGLDDDDERTAHAIRAETREATGDESPGAAHRRPP